MGNTEIRRILFLKVPETRRPLLLSEIDRVAQVHDFHAADYKVHREEIHTKLVQIMRERLLVHLRGLPQIVESWNRPEDNDPQPSQFARSLTKVIKLNNIHLSSLHLCGVFASLYLYMVILLEYLSICYASI
ncbi:Vacuolar protein sorting-associated protein 54, chloroplastic [Vitis vinifera]|uniref:Vacuolar protein sorting-associated protein 54, chloroplastic n=1 Tax=Vitis vinifera TaxID=29760 RepID=A0A438J756_VITVI|nr:Vacuolar protein sorting-associated protein 54, chloroplastic [Vitis vinifera]